MLPISLPSNAYTIHKLTILVVRIIFSTDKSTPSPDDYIPDQWMIVMSTQLIGFSIGGIARRFLVQPPSMSEYIFQPTSFIV
jgi:hypothetical protein